MHITAEEIGGKELVKKTGQFWQSFAQRYVQKRLGNTNQGAGKASTKKGGSKMRRTKAYHNIMQIHNMMVGIGKRLPNLIINRLPDGTWPDPFGWEGANFSSDRAADMVSVESFLNYEANANVNFDYDPSHDAKNAGKQTLKVSRLWSHQVHPPHSFVF